MLGAGGPQKAARYRRVREFLAFNAVAPWWTVISIDIAPPAM
jgi:hypothetical protein